MFTKAANRTEGNEYPVEAQKQSGRIWEMTVSGKTATIPSAYRIKKGAVNRPLFYRILFVTLLN